MTTISPDWLDQTLEAYCKSKDIIQRKQLSKSLLQQISRLDAISIMRICNCLQSATLSQSCCEFLCSNLGFGHTILVIPFVVEHCISTTVENCQRITDILVQSMQQHGIDHHNPVPLMVFSRLSTLGLTLTKDKQKLVYWAQRLQDIAQISAYNRLLSNIVSALILNNVLTPNILTQCWTNATHETKILISDILQVQSNQACLLHVDFAQILATVNTWRRIHIASNGSNDPVRYQNFAHNIHLLDKFRSGYIVSLYTMTKDATKLEKATAQSYIQSSFSNSSTAQAIYEINTYTAVFKIDDHEPLIAMTMPEILINIVILFMRITQVEQPQDMSDNDYATLIASKQELQKLAFTRLRQELIDMSGKCISGHLNRLFNATYGIIPLERPNMREDIKDSLQRAIKEQSSQLQDEIIEQMVDQDYSQEVLQAITNIIGQTYQKVVTANNIELNDVSAVEQIIEVCNAFFNTEHYIQELFKNGTWPKEMLSRLAKNAIVIN